jgi:hypothetical protein
METIPDHEMSVPAAEIWAIFRETAEIGKEIKRIHKETEQIVKETEQIVKETARSQKETAQSQKETDRQIKALDRQMGGLHNSFGELAEYLVTPGIVEKFNALGYHFVETSSNCRISNEQGKILAEIDLLLENGDFIVAVEVKTRPNEQDIPHHIRRLEILRQHKDKIHNSKLIRGAIAGAVFSAPVKKAAIEAGLYVIVQSGDTMKIESPEGFTPREW